MAHVARYVTDTQPTRAFARDFAKGERKLIPVLSTFYLCVLHIAYTIELKYLLPDLRLPTYLQEGCDRLKTHRRQEQLLPV